MFKRKIVLGLTVMVFLFAAIFILFACGESDTKDATNDKQLWTCGMHPQVIQEEPGNCPICGMKLTPLNAETRGTTQDDQMHDHDSTNRAEMDRTEGKKDKKILYWRAPMDPTYISDKPGKSPMGMDLVPVYEGEEPTSASMITIDPVTVQNMGVRTAEVTRQPFYRNIRTVGHVDYNENKLYDINVKFPGWIDRLYVAREGEPVRKGQALLKIYSPELVATQEEYLLAYKNAEKLRDSEIQTVSTSAQRLLRAAEKRLEYWDISDEQIQELQQSGQVQKTLTIYSPANGIVMHKIAVEGQYVKGGEKLFRIADLSTVWVLAHIFEYELPWIKLGQEVKMELPYIPGRQFKGKIDYIYPYLHAKTRDVRIRLVFENTTGELKPEMYANIVIESKLGDDVLVIPSEAVIRTGTRNLIFIDLGDGKFRPQEVVLGPEGENGLVQVDDGVYEGQQIVTSAQFLLDSESRLREAVQKMLESRTKAASSTEQTQTETQHQQ